MDKTMPRYNAGIQRSKGLMEIGAALYDTSLARKGTRGGTKAPQIDSRLGTNLSLKIAPRKDSPTDRGLGISFGIGGSRENFLQVANKEIDLLWINPNAPLALAYKGLPPFAQPLPLRSLAVLPSWDAVVIAVHERTGITSIGQIAERRAKLRISTGETIIPPYDEDGTMFAVNTVISAAGFSLADIRTWGGTIQTVSRPSHPNRSDAIDKGELDAIFDEGILSWGNYAVERGFRMLPIEGALRDKVIAAGYDMIDITPARIPGLPKTVPSLDFSGWPMIVHADMEDDVAYALCEAIEMRKLVIPTDNYKPLDMAQICSGGEEVPLGAPLHPGAARFYRERGYLRS